MGTKIIVGYDGRDPSLDAVVVGRVLAEATGAELALVLALPYDALLLGLENYEQALEQDTKRLLEPAREHLDEIRFETLAYGGESPAHLLNDLAERERAEMIVLGSTSRGPIGRLLPGSVAERLLAGSPCAVAVAPRGYVSRQRRAIGSIGVGYDGSDEARRALDLARSLAASTGASLVLHTVIGPPGLASPDAAWMAVSALGGEEWEIEGRRERELEESMSDALGELSGEVAASGDQVAGDPGRVLVKRSADHDLMVIGSRGYGPVRRVLLGGVSGRVMREAACPVIAVPRGAREA